MTPYSIALFLHVVGALGLFVAIGLEWVSVTHVLRAKTAEQAREWLGAYRWIRLLGPASTAAVLLPGIHLMVNAGGGAGWIVVGFAAMLLLVPFGASNGRRLAALERDLAGERGELSSELHRRLHHPLYLTSILVRTAILLGIVFLMTTKPDVGGSVTAIATAILLGLAASLPKLSRERVKPRVT